MKTRTYRAAPGAYLVFAGITLALEILWLGAAWRSGVVTWGPLVLLGLVYGLCVAWLARFRLELTPEELRVVTPFTGERRLERADILGVEFVAPASRNEGPFTLAIHVKDGVDLRLNAKLFSREAVQSLLELAPAASRAA